MAEAKQSNRQRMINMMYIVLIAMLALNVDRHVLKAFHLMETGFLTSNVSFDQRNAQLMSSFNKILQEDKAKAQPYYDAALEAQQITDEFDTYMNNLKQDMEDMYDGRVNAEEGEDGLTSLKSPEAMEKHANYFMVKNGGKAGEELQAKINSTRDKLLALLKPGKDSLFVDETKYRAVEQANLLNAEEPTRQGPEKRSWASTYLEYQPAGALMAMFSQFQNNAKALEADVIGKLMQGVNSSSFIIDELDAAILPKSNYVMEGETYEADVMLMATTSSAQPTITVNGAKLTTMEGNVGKIQLPASGIGEKKVTGTIEVADPKTGEPKTYSYEHTYQVFKPVATVSAEAMKILYVGLDNPLSISVPGFTANDITVTAAGGATISGGNGTYKVDVDGSQKTVKITVTAKGRSMGTTEYKVRSIPEPRTQLGGVKSDGRSKPTGALCAQDRILANLGEGFAYDLPYVVTRYKIILDSKRGTVSRVVTGNRLPADIKQKMCGMVTGDRVFIEQVKVKNMEYGITDDALPAMFVVR